MCERQHTEQKQVGMCAIVQEDLLPLCVGLASIQVVCSGCCIKGAVPMLALACAVKSRDTATHMDTCGRGLPPLEEQGFIKHSSSSFTALSSMKGNFGRLPCLEECQRTQIWDDRAWRCMMVQQVGKGYQRASRVITQVHCA